MTPEERIVLKNALETYGGWPQIMMCIEECAELTNALAKMSRNRGTTMDIVTEIADVSIIIDQLSMMFGEMKVHEERVRKIERLKERLERAKKGDIVL